MDEKCKLCWQCFFNPDECGERPVRDVVIEEGLYKGEKTDRCSGFKEGV